MLSPGTAFLLAYLPARRVAQTARLELVERNATTIDAKLTHAVAFSREALKTEESMVADVDARLASLAGSAGVALPPVPPARDVPAWLAALPGHVAPHLTTPVLAAAWAAGETARLVFISAALAAHLAYLRTAAPENADLRAQANDRARDLTNSAAALTTALTATGLPLVVSGAGNVAKMVSLTSDLEPTTTGGYRQLNELARDLANFIEATARQLDVAPPAPVSAPPTAAEEALLARILAEPSAHRVRLELAELAAKRADPRAELIRLQLAPATDAGRQRAHDLVRSHPEWTAALTALGARDIKFEAGFPDEVTLDAAVWLARGAELLAAAPLTKLHLRAAAGRVAEIVRSPRLATIELLDLDHQGVTDDDVIALVGSPHAARLRQLDLRYNPLTTRAVDAIAASPLGKRLEVVSLDGNAADPVDRIEYVDETNQRVVPTAAGTALETKHGPLRWLHRA